MSLQRGQDPERVGAAIKARLADSLGQSHPLLERSARPESRHERPHLPRECVEMLPLHDSQEQILWIGSSREHNNDSTISSAHARTGEHWWTAALALLEISFFIPENRDSRRGGATACEAPQRPGERTRRIDWTAKQQHRTTSVPRTPTGRAIWVTVVVSNVLLRPQKRSVRPSY